MHIYSPVSYAELCDFLYGMSEVNYAIVWYNKYTLYDWIWKSMYRFVELFPTCMRSLVANKEVQFGQRIAL